MFTQIARFWFRVFGRLAVLPLAVLISTNANAQGVLAEINNNTMIAAPIVASGGSVAFFP